MPQSNTNRRQFLRTTLAATGSALFGAAAADAGSDSETSKLHLACNQYPWQTFFARQQRDFNRDLSASIAEFTKTGIQGFEPALVSLTQLDRLAPLLSQHHLQMRSLYVNSVLHEASAAEQSIATILAISERAKQLLGTRIIVTNPSPIRWGGPESKTDDQLKFQARQLNRLGGKLSAMGLVLAYHNHDVELRHAAREFHHMMLGTDREKVTLCLDAHWVYRGSGNSSVALRDIVKLYGPRVTELHLRQSRGGVWTETLCDGDIDYRVLAADLLSVGVKPHLVLEQAVEKGSPNTMDAVVAHQRSRQYAQVVFAEMAG